MKTRFLTILVAVALALAIVPAPSVEAQAYTFPLPGVSAAGALTADDTSVALYCKYVGTGAAGYVTTSAGNIAFESPDSSTADTTFECPVSAPLGGIIDTTNAACNTLEEVVEATNSSTSNFRCFIHGGLSTDSSNTRLLAAADVDCTAGCAIYWDTSTAFETPYVVAPQMSTGEWLDFYLGSPSSSTPVANPWAPFQSVIFSAIGTSTYGSGTSLGEVHSVKVGANTVDTIADTNTQLWSEAGGATTAAKTFNAWGSFGIYGRKGEKLLFKLKNSAAQASATVTVNGQQFGVRANP